MVRPRATRNSAAISSARAPDSARGDLGRGRSPPFIEWHKLSGAGWIDGGGAVLGYWQKAVAVPAQGSAPITFDWYRSFLQLLIDNHVQGLFGWLIAVGELAVGVALLVGALVGIAAFFGIVMNMSYLLAGSTSVNPVMFALAIGLILAWRVAGFYGVDRWLLPRLGVPWRAPVVIPGRS